MRVLSSVEQYLSWVFPGNSGIRASVLSTLISSFTSPAQINARLAVDSVWFSANPNVVAATGSSVAVNWSTLIPAIVLSGFCLAWVLGERFVDYLRVRGSQTFIGRLLESVRRPLQKRSFSARVATAVEPSELLNIDLVTHDAKALVEQLSGLSGMVLGKSSTTSNAALARAMKNHGNILRQLATRVVQITTELKELRDDEHADIWQHVEEHHEKGEADDSHPNRIPRFDVADSDSNWDLP